MTFDADALRTGAVPEFRFQDAQEVPYSIPLSSTELLDALRSEAALDVDEIREAFASLMQQVNCGVCFLVAAEQAVRAIHSPLDEDLPLPIVRAVQNALVAPTHVFNRVETHNAYSHVLPEVESALKALSEECIADRAQLASDVEALIVYVHMASFSSTFAVFEYVNEVLSTIAAHRAVPALPPGFILNGIPLHRYNSLGQSLLAAL
jgi:hypothetical protein